MVSLLAKPMSALLSPIVRILYRRSGTIWFNRSEQPVLEEEELLFRYFSRRGFTLNPFTARWFDSDNAMLFDEYTKLKQVERETGYRWDPADRSWVRGSDQIGVRIKTDTLERRIADTFSVKITDQNWQHWERRSVYL